MMIWLLYILIFAVGIFCGLCLFAWLEKELIMKLLLLKTEILHSINQELKNVKISNKKKGGKK